MLALRLHAPQASMLVRSITAGSKRIAASRSSRCGCLASRGHNKSGRERAGRLVVTVAASAVRLFAPVCSFCRCPWRHLPVCKRQRTPHKIERAGDSRINSVRLGGKRHQRLIDSRMNQQKLRDTPFMTIFLFPLTGRQMYRA